jgi:hypothetical protein
LYFSAKVATEIQFEAVLGKTRGTEFWRGSRERDGKLYARACSPLGGKKLQLNAIISMHLNLVSMENLSFGGDTEAIARLFQR